jgi:hypothetical protein
MATYRVTLTSTALRNTRIRITGKRFKNVHALMRIFRGFLAGAYTGTVAIAADASNTAATATVTAASVSAGDTVVLGNITLTSHASTNTGLNFAVGASDTACATNLAAAINRHATLSLYFLATSALGVVTITCIGKALGVIGNLLKVTSSNNTRLAVVAFASGADDASAVSHTF